ncbi:BZ3500_MvSof-1268-A1-R1_Chr4-4g07552 [Microbotryum saponariae]|uniref:BZ3500_MvSof-1268-A1-R1_Chr4-4g07552 protein n=1 Tax=Microbotryum saponariae TaxID=289078 RepID=A0A2X0KXQ0_9BASI|nr:BZ3500_MvSof-1268-A1-R1_Chr4-4g07552 [Microbotryum saponariae]SDA07213.1 BZ3501_MvSof-1269-A2-R1_Chr4-3g07260 [Microbotryum saponariae]
MLEVSYANSSALSTKHYKLVNDLEHAQSDEETLRIVVRCLREIKASWKKGSNLKPSTMTHDLLLVLYCYETIQSLERAPLTGEEKGCLDWEVWLIGAVQLAGRGVGTAEEERGVGYRVCDALFPPGRAKGNDGTPHDDDQDAQHPLKLLLDLFTPLSSPRAEASWVLGLRAAASDRIAGPELVPAIAGRVVELLGGEDGINSSIRRLALEAIQNLLEVGPNARLLERTRKIIHHSLMQFSPSKGNIMEEVSEKVKGKRRAVLETDHEPESVGSKKTIGSTRGKELDPKLVLAFVRATRRRTKGGLYPISGGEQEGGAIMEACLGILGKVVDPPSEGEGAGWDDKAFECGGLKCVWLALGVLERVVEELREGVVAEEMMGRITWEVVKVAKWAEGGRKGVRDALFLTLSELLSLLPPSNLPTPSDLDSLLTPVARSLQAPSTNSRLFALRALSLLPTSLWSTLSDESKGWGPQAWSAIIRGLDDADAQVRKSTVRVLGKVEGDLVGMYWVRVVEGVRGAAAGEDGKAVGLGVERLMEVVEVTKKGGEEWAGAIMELVRLVSGLGGVNGPMGEIVLPTIERFTYTSDKRTRHEIAKALLEGQEVWSGQITLALILAAVVHALASPSSSEEGDEDRAIMDASKKMLALLDQDLPLALELQEPFLVALLRLSGSIVDRQVMKELHSLVQGCGERRATFATRPLFETLEMGLQEGSVERGVVRRMSGSKRYEGLTLPAWEGVFRGLVRKARREEGRGEERFSTSSPARTNATQAGSTPLKYDPYTTSSANSHPSTHTLNLSESSTTTSLAEQIGISPRALARERQDLLRDRVERGGKGGMGESLMFDV